jgi:hypothetical protein
VTGNLSKAVVVDESAVNDMLDNIPGVDDDDDTPGFGDDDAPAEEEKKPEEEAPEYQDPKLAFPEVDIEIKLATLTHKVNDSILKNINKRVGSIIPHH